MRIEELARPLRTCAAMDVIATGGLSEGSLSHKCGSIAVDPRGVPYILYSAGNESTSEMLIAAPNDRMGWKQTSLARQWPGWQIGPAANMAFDKQETMFAIAILSRENKSGIVLLVSYDDGDSFSMRHLSSHLPCDCKWWPNLERPTDHNVTTERPGVLFTAGSHREGNDDILSNDVYWIGW